MNQDGQSLTETITLSQAKELIQCLAHRQSVLMLSPPGVGKSATVAQAAAEAGLPCRSLLGTQISPEDVSGVPRIVGERSVFCPPRVLLPEDPQPFCLFLDELPACSPDIQKAFYSLLLERRIGEHRLPEGTWVVAAGNRAEDRAMVRTISNALINRVIVLNVREDLNQWIGWAEQHGVRREIIAFVRDTPAALLRPIPLDAVPFSSPRSWALLSRALDLAQRDSLLDEQIVAALAGGRISPRDVQPFCIWWRICQQARDDLGEVGLRGLLNLGVSDLGLSQRAIHILEAAGIAIVRELVVLKEFELLASAMELDQARVAEIKESLAAKGLWLGMQLTQADLE